MNIETTELPSVLVAGLAVRTNNEKEKDPKTGWLMKTWQRAGKKKFDGPVAAVLTDYESDGMSYYTEVIGHVIRKLDDLTPGEVLAQVPAGKYAKFTVKGEMPSIVLEAWKQVWQAEADGSLSRAYTADLERYPEPGTVELFIAIK